MKKQIAFRWLIAILLLPAWVSFTIALVVLPPCGILVIASPIIAIGHTLSYLAGGMSKGDYQFEIKECGFMFISPILGGFGAPAYFIRTGRFTTPI